MGGKLNGEAQEPTAKSPSRVGKLVKGIGVALQAWALPLLMEVRRQDPYDG